MRLGDFLALFISYDFSTKNPLNQILTSKASSGVRVRV